MDELPEALREPGPRQRWRWPPRRSPRAHLRPRPPRLRLVSLGRLGPFLKPYRGHIGLALGLLGIGSAAMLLAPLALRRLVDHGFTPGASLARYFLPLFAVAVFWGGATAGRFYAVSWLGERVVADLRQAIYRHMLRQSPAYFETTRTGEVLSRLTADTTLVQTVVGSSVSMGLRSLFQFFGGLVMLAVTSLKLFAATVVLLAVVVLPLVTVGRAVRRLSRESQDRVADSSAVAGEILNAMPTVQAFTKEADEAARFDASVEASFRSAIERSRLRAALTGAMIAGVFGALITVLWLAAHDVAQGTITGGQLAAFVLYAIITAGGAGVLAEVWGDVMRAAGATERLLELLAAVPAIAAPAAPVTLPGLEAGAASGRVAFEEVRFHYPSRPNQRALDGVSFTVEPGEMVALVGPSGAGKTTIFQLLLRFYDVTGGAVRLDGVDVRALDPGRLRGRLGIVPQDSVIFSASALENIRYGNAGATDAAVVAAARLAHADAFIERLPEGYGTFLGERGVRLSGGQRQRIAIARAILRNPPVLMLDEATSALDAESEILVQQGLEAAMRGRTTLVIAHRLATVRRADRIIVLEQGRIVEAGPPAELLERGGLYARLASLQVVA